MPGHLATKRQRDHKGECRGETGRLLRNRPLSALCGHHLRSGLHERLHI